MMCGGRCWFTRDFFVTWGYVGYSGYKVCGRSVNVAVDSDVGLLYGSVVPADYRGFYSDRAYVGGVGISWVRFVADDVSIVSDPGDIPPELPVDLIGFWVSRVIPSTRGVVYYVNNHSDYDIYLRGEVYVDGDKMCENEVFVPVSNSNVRLVCSVPGSRYKVKLYVSVDRNTWHHVETRWFKTLL